MATRLGRIPAQPNWQSPVRQDNQTLSCRPTLIPPETQSTQVFITTLNGLQERLGRALKHIPQATEEAAIQADWAVAGYLLLCT